MDIVHCSPASGANMRARAGHSSKMLLLPTKSIDDYFICIHPLCEAVQSFRSSLDYFFCTRWLSSDSSFQRPFLRSRGDGVFFRSAFKHTWSVINEQNGWKQRKTNAFASHKINQSKNWVMRYHRQISTAAVREIMPTFYNVCVCSVLCTSIRNYFTIYSFSLFTKGNATFYCCERNTGNEY